MPTRRTFEREALWQTLRLRDRDAISGSLIRGFLKRWLVLSAIFLTGAAYTWMLDAIPAAALFVGIWFGCVLADIGQIRIRARIWPISRQITDWNRVEELLEKYESAM